MATKTSYRAVIKCDADNDGQDEYYEMDVVNPVNENFQSDITEHPLVEGNMLADHMIIQPMTMTLSGKFSLSGAKPTSYDGEFGRLANIQDLFERLLKNGTFCSIVHMSKISGDGAETGKIRFKQRDNMVLNGISWVTGNNSLEATLSFREVQTAEVDEVLYDVDRRDPNLPALTDAQTMDFTDNFLDWGKVDEMVLKMCWDCKFIDEGFLELVVTVNTIAINANIIVAIAALVAAGIIVNAVIAGTLSASAAIFPAGTIIAGVAIVALGIAALLSWFNRMENAKKYKIKAFKRYETDRENQAEIERFQNFIGSIHQQLEQLENVIKVYSIPVNEPQECMLYIDDNYYIFVFEKNNTTGKWSLKVKDVEDKIRGQQSQIAGLSSIDECSSSNALFRTIGVGSYVYVMNSKQQELATNGASQEEIDEANNDLKNYSILISKINMDDFTQVLQDIIKNALEA